MRNTRSNRNGDRSAVRGTIAKTLIAAGVLFAIAIVLNRGSGESPVAAQTAPEPATAAQKSARIVTANIRYADPKDVRNLWSDRRDFLLETVLKQSPDIIGFQEVTPAQGAWLEQKLRGYKVAPRDDGKRSLLGAITEIISSMNMLAWRTDRFDEISSANGSLGAITGVDASELTFYTQVILKDKTGQLPDLIVIDVHLRHVETQAIAATRDVHKLITQWRQQNPGAEVVIMGDMNHERTTKVYASLARPDAPAIQLVDTHDYAAKKQGERWGTFHGFTGRVGQEWPVDLILHSPGLSHTPAVILRDRDANGKYPSDHFFVTTSVTR